MDPKVDAKVENKVDHASRLIKTAGSNPSKLSSCITYASNPITNPFAIHRLLILANSY